MRALIDGGGFPIFRSFHDYRIKNAELVNRSRHSYQRAAFEQFKNALDQDPHWRAHFTPDQVRTIQKSLLMNNPTIDGFTWHHHQDCEGEILQLVERTQHQKTGHTGGWALATRF